MTRTVLAMALALLLGSCASPYDGPVEEVYVEAPPPPPVVTVVRRPVCPSPRHVWIDGHYVHRRGGYRWVAGHWHVPPRRRARWVAPRHRVGPRGRHVWVRGGWR